MQLQAELSMGAKDPDFDLLKAMTACASASPRGIPRHVNITVAAMSHLQRMASRELWLVASQCCEVRKRSPAYRPQS